VGERTRYEPGEFCWVGLATSDLESAKAFYTSLFGWEAEDLSAGDAGTYTELRRDGKGVAILYRQTEAGSPAPPHWTSYVSVEGADATAARVRELGGTLLRGPVDLIDAGRVAAVRDPVGAIVSFWQPRSHIGASLVDEVDALCWHELVTPDVERAKSFYGDLLGWEYETEDTGYTTIKNAGSLNGGMREGIPANWLPYYMVESADAAQFKAVQVRGRMLAPPNDNPFGRFAVLADPQGAAFAVFERGKWGQTPA
jgi:uncharacterized protein